MGLGSVMHLCECAATELCGQNFINGWSLRRRSMTIFAVFRASTLKTIVSYTFLAFGDFMQAVQPIHVTDASFQADVLDSTLPVLIDFWAAWCGPCRMIAPIMDELAVELDGKVKIAKVDVDNNPRVALEYGIRSIPALLLFHEGKIVDNIVGLVPKNYIMQHLEPFMAK